MDKIRAEDGEVEDLASLSKLDEQVLLHELKNRYSKDRIYTYVGDILISVNPFRDLGIYGEDVSSQYCLASKSSVPPHIFAVADNAYQSMVGYAGRIPTSQCILISGESGAGKTECTKLIIKQLIEICRGRSQLENQILQVNPLLEAFGNAQTLMNDNSSRFGKYIQLKFSDGHVRGAKISEYLLEKSRVVRQNPGEENFHIFYYMFAGLSPEDRHRYKLQSSDSFRYLTNGASKNQDKLSHAKKEFNELVNSMDLVGFSDEEQADLFTMIASVLHLGNVKFEMDDTDAAHVTNREQSLKLAAELLQISPDEVEACLTSMVTVTRGDYVKRNYTKQQAEDVCDAMAKIIYGRLFGWIVNKVNSLLAPELDSAEEMQQLTQEIGILDIFGFEHFEKNSFEQACINLANEQLQFFFNKHIFQLEQEEYKREGIDWTEIKFVDNQPLLNLFLARPIGLLAILDEESHFPQATDHTFVEKMNANFGKNNYYVKSPSSISNKFSILHYAGKVTYDAENWLEKNRDTLAGGIMEILQESNNKLVQTIFRGKITRTGTLALQGNKTTRKTRSRKALSAASLREAASKRKLTVSAQFKTSLQILMERMTASTPVFVRCLKPNHKKLAKEFDDQYILAQLLYTGMLETTKIRREGFAVRPQFEEFVEKYRILCDLKMTGTAENCLKILKSSGITGWHIGKTKVFLKYYHIEQLSDLLVKIDKAAVHLQRVARGYLARCRFHILQYEANKFSLQLKNFLHQVEMINDDIYQKQQNLLEKDKLIPKDYFIKSKPVVPTVPDFPPTLPTQSKSKGYEVPTTGGKSAGVSMGIQVGDGDSDSSENLEDVFVNRKPSPNSYGKKGTKEAAVGWFQATQTDKVLDSSGTFAQWFHGIITRRESERLLQDKPVGCFLIRVSESRFGYSLSFKVEGRCRHYMIDHTKNGKYIITGENKVHRTLAEMVDYYQGIPISNWKGVLTLPCGQDQGQCDYAELVGDNMYFVLEKHDEPGYNKLEPASGEHYVHLPGNYIEFVPQPSGSQNAPPIPERNYSRTPVSGDSHRPLPRLPEEAHKSLLANQQMQHGSNETSQKRTSAIRVKRK